MKPPAKRRNNRDDRGPATNERLEARVSSQQKLFFQRAAALRGVTLTDFMIESLQTAAAAAIEQHNVLTLSLEDSHKFLEALTNPPAPNKALLRAAERYRRMQDR